MIKAYLKERWPGVIAAGATITVTMAWTFWGVMELFHEGWYSFLEFWMFFVPALVCLLLTLLALRWPRIGGGLLILVGGWFFLWQTINTAQRFGITLGAVLSWIPVSAVLVLFGVLFIIDARRKKRSELPRAERWWLRNLGYLLAVGGPLILGIGLAISPTIRLITRVDDGDRGIRTIENSSGEMLVWAPAGPGWVNTGNGPSYNEIALYGVEPIGFDGKRYGWDDACSRDDDSGCATAEDMAEYNVCRYLSADGLTLMDTPQNVWRMPTIEEVVESLVHHGEPAGCAWTGEEGFQPCDQYPDKETPLWDPTERTIYLWAADPISALDGPKVAYNGSVYGSLKYSSLGSMGYRCVREP